MSGIDFVFLTIASDRSTVIDNSRAAVEQHSKELRRELRIRDLALMQIVLVFSFSNLGPAARQGPTHVAFWLLSIAVFYLPLAAITIFLSRSMPLEGGVYQWAKFGLNPLSGFLAGWNYAVFLVLQVAPIGLIAAASSAYALGPAGEWIAGSRWMIAIFNAAILGAILAVNIRGFHIEKWFSNAASFTILALCGALIILLFVHPGHHAAPLHKGFSLAIPAMTLASLNLFSKIGFNSLSGLEYVAFFAGESVDPGRSIARSVWIAAPVIALLYILTTGSTLVYIAPEDVDMTATVPQVLSAASGGSHWLAWISAVTITLLTLAVVVQLMVVLAAVSRLPMVAGWDDLLPAWFTKLHPRYSTPSRSIWVVIAACFAFGMMSLLGVGRDEAFQLVYTTSFASLGIYYVILFAIPLWGMRSFARRPGFVLRIAAASGLAVTALSIAFQLVPIVDVKQPLVFGCKVGLTTAVINLCGFLLYRRGQRASAGEQRAEAP
jgi:amino acid transporter